MTQAIGRIFRGNKKKYVYILSGFDIKMGVPVISYKSHSDLQNKLKLERKTLNNESKHDKSLKILQAFAGKHKFLTVLDCQSLFRINNYKAKTMLKNFANEGHLVKKIGNRGKHLYFLKK